MTSIGLNFRGWGVGVGIGIIALGAVLGLVASVSWPTALVLAASVWLMLLLTRVNHHSELVVGLYWATFCLYETVFRDVSFPGLFYPFYLVMIGTVLLRLGVGRLPRPTPLILWYVGFLLLVMVSFVGFGESISFEVFQRLIAYGFGLLVFLQFASRRGLDVVIQLGLLTSVAMSVWVVASAIQEGFAYRGGVEGDQNVIALFVGFGTVIAIALGVDLIGRRRHLALIMTMLALGFTLYASLLLASRGIFIALAVALLAVVVRVAFVQPRKLLFGFILVLLAVSAFFLPGGQGLVERFSGERVESGGSRLPLWEAAWTAYVRGTPVQLLVGQGFDSSKFVIRQVSDNLTSTHNAYFQVLFEFGLLGLLVFMGLHVVVLWRAWRLPGPHGWVAFALVVFLLGADVTVNVPDGFMYWTVLGFALAAVVWGGVDPVRQRLDAVRSPSP